MADPCRFLNGKVALYPGDMLDVLPALPENSVDAVVTDPPYHLTSIVKRFGAEGAAKAQSGKSGVYKRSSAGFMGKVWDGGKIAFQPETWAAVLRVMKPGAYLLAFSSCRTFGRMQVAIEDAGFITHPFVAWIFGQGFPKAHRINADGWEGWRYGGQALKPAIEPIYMGQKPFSESSGTANVLRWGTGALNIDGCRVEGVVQAAAGATAFGSGRDDGYELGTGRQYTNGRWPANILHDGSEEVVGAFPETGVSSGGRVANISKTSTIYGGGKGLGQDIDPAAVCGDPGFGDSGSAARFFYTAKADAEDRAGSRHPTVKPLDLIQYLCRLITPPGGTVLDPFAGTGTTGEAAFREGFRAILIEREAEYQADIARRMEWALLGPESRAHAQARLDTERGKVKAEPMPLFGGEAA